MLFVSDDVFRSASRVEEESASKGMMVELEKQAHLQKVVGAGYGGQLWMECGSGHGSQAARAMERFKRNRSKYCHVARAILVVLHSLYARVAKRLFSGRRIPSREPGSIGPCEELK